MELYETPLRVDPDLQYTQATDIISMIQFNKYKIEVG